MATDPQRSFIPATETMLDALSVYSAQDIDDCVAQWDADGDAESSGLLDAEADDANPGDGR